MIELPFMKLYLVRHAESESNKNNSYHFPGTPLSKDGIRQAKILAKKIGNLQVDFIYSSDLKRARQTAKIVSEKVNKKVKHTRNLRELRRPSILWGKTDEDQNSKIYVKLQKENFNDPEWKFTDDESFNDLKKRASKVLDNLSRRHSDKNVLVVSHGAIIKMMVSLAILGKDLSPLIFWNLWHNLWIKNTGIVILEHNQNKWTLVVWNDTSHFDA